MRTSILISDLIKYPFLFYRSIMIYRKLPFSIEDAGEICSEDKWEEGVRKQRGGEESPFL